MKTRKA